MSPARGSINAQAQKPSNHLGAGSSNPEIPTSLTCRTKQNLEIRCQVNCREWPYDEAVRFLEPEEDGQELLRSPDRRSEGALMGSMQLGTTAGFAFPS
jgi:hypothetical protein